MAIKQAASLKSESGFTLIDLLFVCSLIGLLSTLAIPGLMRARGVAQSASAVGTLRVINSAQLSYAVTCGSGFYSPDLPTLGVAPPSAFQAFLPPELTTGSTFNKSGYTFSLTGTGLSGAPGSCNGLSAGRGAPGYVAIGDPIDPVGNPHFFGTNADGTIYEHSSTLSGVLPESGPSPAGTAIR
ncbi:MAG: type II secretion system protein [Acidobacteria bacterium]|nr:type II secretion system protein [Acidobacteriota bacterium]